MSVYPMTIRSVSMHQTTKSYHLTIITRADGRSVFIRRWGKKGAFGDMKVELYNTRSEAERAWDKMDKAKREYKHESLPKTATVDEATELRSAVGISVWAKIGKEAINWLDPDIKTDGMREAEPPRLGEDGKLSGEDGPRSDTKALKDAIEAQRLAEEAEAAQTLKHIPNFGRFG